MGYIGLRSYIANRMYLDHLTSPVGAYGGDYFPCEACPMRPLATPSMVGVTVIKSFVVCKIVVESKADEDFQEDFHRTGTKPR